MFRRVLFRSPYAVRPSDPLPLDMALMDIPPTRVWVPPLEGGSPPPNIGKFEELVREAEALHYRSFLSMGILPPPQGNDSSFPPLGRVARGVKKARASVISSYPTAPPSGPALLSLSKVRRRVASIVALPMQDSLTTVLRPGSRREKVVACGLDVVDNRRVLHRLTPPLLLPGRRQLVPR